MTKTRRTGVVIRSESNLDTMTEAATEADADFVRRSVRIATLWLAIIVAAGVGLVVFSDAFLATFA